MQGVQSPLQRHSPRDCTNSPQNCRTTRRRLFKTFKHLTCCAAGSTRDSVYLLDYGAGNVRSVHNACKRLGYELQTVRSPADLQKADRLIFPGVGACGQCVDALKAQGFLEPLRDYLLEGKPYLGICLGLQVLFEGSDESGGLEGLGIVPGRVSKFDYVAGNPVPQIGWNTLSPRRPSKLLHNLDRRRFYFVNSYRAAATPANDEWTLATTKYNGDFISVVQKGEVYATQFHPEKSGQAGLDLLDNFLRPVRNESAPTPSVHRTSLKEKKEEEEEEEMDHRLAKRVVVALDVRTNDNGDLVVTKGDQYDVREGGTSSGGDVRNLGKPVELAERYFREGADEISFLNITGFRDFPLGDLPMLEVMKRASQNIFVPLTVGGGIRAFMDECGQQYTALQVAAEYFRSGADKVSIGGDAVEAVLKLRAAGGVPSGDSSIETISWHYGAQAVVVSIDPRRVWVHDRTSCIHPCIRTHTTGPGGEEFCYWQCTVQGGREDRDIDAVTLARGVEALGAGEIMLNCIDRDGTNSGFDIELVKAVSDAVTIPVIASSGAGCPEHFSEVLLNTNASAALAAGMFHREEVAISDVKRHLHQSGVPTRLT